MQHRELRLLAGEPDSTIAEQSGKVDGARPGVVGHADRPRQATIYDARQRIGHLSGMGEQVGPVHLVQVDVIDPEPTQRCLTSGGQVDRARVVRHTGPDATLGRQDHPIAARGGRGEDLTEHGLAGTERRKIHAVVAIDVGGIHEGEAGVQCGVDPGGRIADLGIGEVPQSEREWRQRHCCPTQHEAGSGDAGVDGADPDNIGRT